MSPNFRLLIILAEVFGMLSGPTAFPCFIFLIAALTSSFKIGGPSMYFFIIGFSPLFSWNRSSIYSDHLFRTSSLSISKFPSFALMQLDAVHPLVPLSLILECMYLLSTVRLFSISLHCSLIHCSLASLHVSLICVFRVLCKSMFDFALRLSSVYLPLNLESPLSSISCVVFFSHIWYLVCHDFIK